MNKKEIKKVKTESVEDVQLPDLVEDEFGNMLDVDEMIDQAENEIEEKKSISVHIRWSKAEIQRCKKIAEKKGLPYQTYIKSVLKQAMDNEDVA